MENTSSHIYIKNLLLSFWRGRSGEIWESPIVIGTFLCIFPFIFISVIINNYFFSGDFFTYPMFFLDQVFFIFCLEIFVLFLHLIFAYFDSINYAKKSVLKEDGSRHDVYYDESISWIDLIKEFVAVSFVYILVLWISWIFLVGIY